MINVRRSAHVGILLDPSMARQTHYIDTIFILCLCLPWTGGILATNTPDNYSSATSITVAIDSELLVGSVVYRIVFDGPDVGEMGEVRLVKLLDGGICDGLGQTPVYFTQAAGWGGDRGGSVSGHADYETAARGEAGRAIAMCEQALLDYTVAETTISTIRISGRTWNVTVGSAVGRATDALQYIRVDAMATTLYYKVSNHHANACETSRPVRVSPHKEAQRGRGCNERRSKSGDKGETEVEDTHPGSARTASSVGIVTTLGIALTVAGATVVVCATQKQRRMHRGTVRVLGTHCLVARVADTAGASETGWVAGVENPLLGWYRPSLTRADCTSYLDARYESTFVVRDSRSTPGWHMLCVKTHDTVVHDKIRRTNSGSYELMPTLPKGMKLLRQPAFPDMIALVKYYERPHEGVSYTLTSAAAHANSIHTDGYAYSESPGKSPTRPKRGNHSHTS